MLGFRQGGFLDLRQRVLTCQPGTVAVPKYGQKLVPVQALWVSWSSQKVRLHQLPKMQKWAFGSIQPETSEFFFSAMGLREAGRRRLSSMCGGQQGFQPNNTNEYSYFHHLLCKTPLYEKKCTFLFLLIGNWDPSILLE